MGEKKNIEYKYFQIIRKMKKMLLKGSTFYCLKLNIIDSQTINAGAKEVLFNYNGDALKKMQNGVDKLATVVGVTLGPKGGNVVLETKYGSPKIVNDGVTVAKEVDLADPVENIGVKLVRQAASKTNESAGDGTSTAIILSAAMIREGMKILAAGSNPTQLVKGIEKTVKSIVELIKKQATTIRSNEDLINIATVSAGYNSEIGKLISDAMIKVGKQGVVTLQESKTATDVLTFVEGMQFDRGYTSPYFVTDPEKMICEYNCCKVLLVDKKITNAKEIVNILEITHRNEFPLMVMADDIEQEVLSILVVNKLRGNLKVVAVKAPGFGDRKTQYLEDLAIMTGATLVKEDLGISLDRVDISILGKAAKIEIGKEQCTIVGDGTFQNQVNARVTQIKNQRLITEQTYEKGKLDERVARLSGGVALLNVGAQTETELKEKKLRVEDALCATKAAVEEGLVAGGGSTFINLSKEIDGIKSSLNNEEQNIGAEIVRRALLYPLRLIFHNAGANGSVILNKVFHGIKQNFGYNAATGKYVDLMLDGVVDPTKVIRCLLENSSSVARSFLTSDCIIYEIREDSKAPLGEIEYD